MGAKDQQTINVAIYARVSTDKQARQEDGSIKSQIKRLRAAFEQEKELAPEGVRYVLVDEYVDAGESAKDLNRPEMERMLNDVRNGRIQHIKVTKLDRITRSLRDFCDLKELFELHGVSFNSLSEKFDTSSPMGEAMIRIVMVFAELERKMIAQRVKETMHDRAEAGFHNGGRIWGYAANPDRKGILLIDEEEAEVIKMIFSKYLEVKSLTQLQRWMQRENIVRPEYISRRGNEQGGNVPCVSALRDLLLNPVYIGKRRTQEGVVDGQHEPIFKKEDGSIQLWEDVQEKLEQRSRSRGQTGLAHTGWKEDPQKTFLLRGLLFCGRCGSAMSPDWALGRDRAHYYYLCTRRSKFGKEKGCPSHRLPAQAIEEAILERVRSFGVDHELIEKLVREANSNSTEKIKLLERDRERVARRLTQVTTEITNFVEVLRKGGAKALRSIQAELENLEEQQEELSTDLQILDDKRGAIEMANLNSQVTFEAYKNLGAILATADPATLAEFLPTIIEKITWDDNGEESRDGTYRMTLYAVPEIPGIAEAVAGENVGSVVCTNWYPQ